MNNLSKMEKVWEDLEKGYADQCKKGKAMTREEYLKDLLAFEGGKPNLTLLRSILGKEINTYSADEIHVYDSLFAMFEKVASRLEINSEVISDLDVFCHESIEGNLASEEKTTIVNLSDYGFYSIFQYTPLRKALQAEVFADYVSANGDCYSVDTQNELYRYFRTEEEVALFISNYWKGKIEKTDFNNKVYVVMMSLIRAHEKFDDVALLAPELYVAKRGRVSLGGKFYPFKASSAVVLKGYKDEHCTMGCAKYVRTTLNTKRGIAEDVIFLY